MRDDGSTCGGILKSATISFGQNLVAHDLRRAEAAAAACDLLLAVGSTLAVFPAAGLVPIASRAGAAVVILNGAPTDMDPLADVVVNGPISELLPADRRRIPMNDWGPATYGQPCRECAFDVDPCAR